MGAVRQAHLKVYQASAGSGKTFRLAVEYIRLLILQPDNYKHILAVTFTNKATSEMKERILSQLYGIWKGLPQSNAYLQALLSMDGLKGKSAAWVEGRAGEALRLLLADYGHFRVETIDAYFQSVLHEVARELALPNDFRLELQTDGVIHQAVSDLSDQLATDTRLLEAMLHIVEERIANSDDWDVRKVLASFGKHLFSEQFLTFPPEKRQHIGDMATVGRYKGIIRKWETTLRQQLMDIGKQFAQQLNQLGINDLLSRAHNTDTAKWMQQLADGKLHGSISDTIRGRAADAGKWLTAKTRGEERDALVCTINEHLRPLLVRAIDVEERTAPLLNTLDTIRSHIDALTFMNVINENVRRLNEQAHRFLLADTAHFLHELIDGSDVPFLYERAGVDFQYIMIDEFQDTSRLQWENFEPLVTNSLDTGKECLIVGDVKQSIYRWRNSDWGILNSLGQQAAYRGRIEQIVQQTNFRSSEQVVQFNNEFFAASNRLLCNVFDTQEAGEPGASADIASAYAQLRQDVLPQQRGRGYVRVTIGTEEGSDALSQVGDTVKELLEAGIPMDDIAILTRKNKDVADIIRHLMARDDMPVPIRVVSAEAFQLDASPALQTLVQALRVLDNPTDRTLLVGLALLYHAGEEKAQDILLTLQDDELWAWLPADFARRRGELPLMSLYELVEWLIRQFRLHEQVGQAAYLFTFLDQLSAFLKANDSDVSAFLNHWDLTLHKKTVAMDDVSGIRLMTIHKAKGLEFSTVIVPFCDWKMRGRTDNILWVDTQRMAPYHQGLNDVSLLPLPFTKATQASLYHQEYVDETKRFFVDNLNLLYVAFTRAADNLLILCASPPEPGKKGTPPLTASRLLKDFVSDAQQGGEGVYEWGTLTQRPHRQAQVDGNPLLFHAEPTEMPFVAHEPMLRFRQSRQAAQFLKQDALSDTPTAVACLDEGNIFHALLARLRTAADAERVLDEAEAEGLFADVAMKEQMRRLLHECLADAQASEWFDAHWHVINERSIVERDGEGRAVVHRPDRVIADAQRTIVIDYKTGHPHPAHQQQVRGYMHLLKRMGYPGVEGYLWYVRQKDNNRIVSVAL